ncbi:MAG: hypothetical protein Q7K13_05950 [Polynucleobacter sp.]|uniref:hypothetical protein n=1 Tax=Polynucleobacter sp. TaxID=2029855 RepID=UPI00271A9214|nr:hypothetical protein [Polynucleobacter sp.]MDO8714005.1 hypothetical protein [Polynucleobacter sp.]
MNDITPFEPVIESISRFQSLQAGQYWISKCEIIEEGIEAGTTLLIESIRCIENVPHTIILRAHPSKHGHTVYLDIPNGKGDTRSKYFTYSSHRFLLDDFLSSFEFEPNHQVIRSAELQLVQGRINALQGELMESQSNPDVMATVIQIGLQKEADKQKQPSNEAGVTSSNVATQSNSSEVANIVTGTIGGAIGSGITTERIAEFRIAADREHQIATIKANWIKGKTSEIADTITAMTPYYLEQAAAALAQTSDVRAYVDKLLQGIESLDLYVGKDVDVMTIRTGASAPKEVPLTFVQKKLMMDEELAVWADVDAWFDFSKVNKFFDALRENDSLVNQIFPTERCILVMASTRRHIDYGDTFANMARNKENEKVFLLVRDGMNIYRVLSSVESHLGTARLFPSQDDQDRVFKGLDGDQIKFEDVAYTDKLTKHEQFALHYKRFLILACGLDHRLKLFGDFYEGPQTLHFISMAFQNQYCRFLHDDDGKNLLPGETRQPLQEWIAEKNTYLRSGARVLCNWNDAMNPDTAPGACKRTSTRSSYGDGYETRYKPENNIEAVIAVKDGSSISVNVAVSGYSYSLNGDRTFNCKVNLSKVATSNYDSEDVPFLCLDAVRPEELHWYIHSRETRKNHISYIRFFKMALKFIESEFECESDTRLRMVKALSDGDIASGKDAEEIIHQAVIAWRAANRGAALPRFFGNAAPEAWTSLLDQMFMLAGEGKRRITDIASYVTELGYTPLRLVISGGAKLVVYAAPRLEERDDRLEPHAWVHRITIEKGKAGYVEKSRRWCLLPRSAASETTLHQWDASIEWAGLEPVFQSYERKQKLFSFASHFQGRLMPYTKQMTSEIHAEQFQDWKTTRQELLKNSKFVRNPKMAVPFGMVYRPKNKTISFLCCGLEHPQVHLHKLAPDNVSMEQVKDQFSKIYNKKSIAHQLLTNKNEWQLMEVEVSFSSEAKAIFGSFFHEELGVSSNPLNGKEESNPLLSVWMSARLAMAKKLVDDSGIETQFWFADGVMDDSGHLVLDDLLGIELPKDFEPVTVHSISLHTSKGMVKAKYANWFDICRKVTESKEDEASRSFWNNKPSISDRLVSESTPAGAFSWSNGYGSRAFKLASMALAREFIAENVKTEYGSQFTAVPSTSLDDCPTPPDGVERFYVVEKEVHI